MVIFFFNDTATTEIYTLSLHDALPISLKSSWPLFDRSMIRPPTRVIGRPASASANWVLMSSTASTRSEEHTSELQSLAYLVCRLLLEKKKNKKHLSYVLAIHITDSMAS